MNNSVRLKNVYINTAAVLFTQIIQIFLSFVLRRIFIEKLGLEYMGYSGVFSNILQMLNLADLGIGVAITSFLYKPIAEEDNKAINALIYIYKKVYLYIAIIISIMGIAISFLIHFIITDYDGNYLMLRIYFLLHLAGVVSSYFFAYKRTLLVADQKSYSISLIDTALNLVFVVLQIFLLIKVPNYIIFLLIAFIQGIVSNVIISCLCDKKYKCLREKEDFTVVDVYKPQVIEYVKDVFISRIGAYVYYSTDNVIISIFKSSLLVGYYSNYSAITLQVYNVVVQILGSIQATFGNFIHLHEDKEQQKKMIDVYLFANYFVGNLCMFCILFLIQPFVVLWIGNDFLLEYSTVILMSVNLLLMILIQVPSQVFIIYKLYKYDKIVIIVSALSNIIISVLLVKSIGINGVLIGTLITSLFYLFSRLYIISSKVFSISCLRYFGRIIFWFISSIVMFLLGYFVFSETMDVTIVKFVFRCCYVAAFGIILQMFFWGWTPECKYLIKKILNYKIKKN